MRRCLSVIDDERVRNQDFEKFLEGLAPHEPLSQDQHNNTKRRAFEAYGDGARGGGSGLQGKLIDFGPWQVIDGEFDGLRRKRVLVKIIVSRGPHDHRRQTHSEFARFGQIQKCLGVNGLSSDAVCGRPADDETNQSIHRAVLATLRYLLRWCLALRRPVTYLDATHLTVRERRPYVKMGLVYGCAVEAIFSSDVPLEVCRKRNRGRPRVVPRTCWSAWPPSSRRRRSRKASQR